MEDRISINIATDFNKNLGGRDKEIGPYSGEAFFEEILEKKYLEAIDRDCHLEINLDGASPYGSSFLDQSFGELYRKYKNDVTNRIVFKTQYFNWIVNYIKQEVWKE